MSHESRLTKGELRPDFDYATILEMASEEDEHGYRILELDIPEGKTAWNPGSTKRLLHGPTKIRYEIHRSGVRGLLLDGRAYGSTASEVS